MSNYLPVEWLRAGAMGRPIGVDRDAKMIRGYVVAQAGPFKTAGRGEFDAKSLGLIVDLMGGAPKGLKTRLAHPTLSADGIGKFLGRSVNPWRDGDKVRADLVFDASAFDTPHGNLADYVMRLAESDPDAMSSSLVLTSDKERRLEKGKPMYDANGNELPPLWRPTALHACDVVDTGEAVDGFLGVDLPDTIVRQATELLDVQFAGQPREVVAERCQAWLSRYLEYRFGETETTADDTDLPVDSDTRARRQRLWEKMMSERAD